MRLRPLAAAGLAGLLAALTMVPAAAQESTQQSPAGAPTAVVVAVDTSRSLTAAELARVGEQLASAVRQLDPATPSALLAFDDAPRWVVEPGASPERVADALGGLRPRGDYTLLNDALFTASRALPGGGVVLLVSDGRDERSAVTVEDIARRSEATEVRVVSLGIGRSILPLALRRLALVTDGQYLGLLEAVSPEQIAQAVTVSGGEVATARATAASPPPTPSPGGPQSERVAIRGFGEEATGGAEADAEPATGRVHPGWMWALLAVVLLAGLTAGLARRRRTAPAPETLCERCGETLDPSGAACQRCAEDELHRQLAERQVAAPGELREVSSDTVIFDPPDDPDALEKTRILTELALLLVRRRGEETRAFVLPQGQAIAVGRGKKGNSLSLADSALSAQHLKIVPDGGRYYVVDLGSTNGTWIDGQRVRAREIASGTVLRVGQIELELKTKTEPALG